MPSIGSTATLLHDATITGMMMSAILTNNHYGTLPITLWITRGVDIINLIKNKRVLSGDFYNIAKESKIVMLIGDKLYAQCPVAAAFSAALTLYKDTSI